MSIFKMPAIFVLLCGVVFGNNFNPSDSLRTCSYFITSEPSNARVFINDSLYGVTPLKLFNFQKLSFNLRLKNDRDSNWVLSVRAPERNEVSIHGLLEAKYSLLNVHSDPEGADLYVNDTLKGKTPMEGLKVMTGLTTIKLVKENYLQKDESFYIPQYSQHRHDMNLKLVSVFSNLDLGALNHYASISIDGKQVNKNDLSRLTIASGEHFISAENNIQGQKLTFDIKTDGDGFYKVVTKTKFQSTPVVLSLFIPGLGQVYDGSYIKGAGIMGGFLGLAAAAYMTADDYSQKKGLYNLRTDKYLSSETEMDALANKKLMLQAKDDLDKAAGPKNLTLGILAGAYIYNLIDVLLFHSVKEIADIKKMQEVSGLTWQLNKDNLSVGMKFNF